MEGSSKALKDGRCAQLWCGLGTSLLSGLQPTSPGDFQVPAHTEGTLWRPGRRVWVCVSKTVYLGAPLRETVSPAQVRVCLCVWLLLCPLVLAWMCTSASVYTTSGVYPSVALFYICLSYVSPSLSPECLSCVSFLSSLFLCVSLDQSLHA